MGLKLTFLGTGTSCGVPALGCDCEVCQSADPRDSRLRTSAQIETDEGTCLLIDCGPDFRQQMLPRPFRPLDGVLLTHFHYDHVGGLDDLRPYCAAGSLSLYADRRTSRYVRQRLPYCFQKHPRTCVPSFVLHTLRPRKPFCVKECEILPLTVMHGSLPIMGYRIGGLAWLTDMKTFPENQLPLLHGLDTLVVDALHLSRPHLTHQNVPEALAFVERVQPRRAFFIHMSHNAGLHASSSGFLPPHVSYAYDGLEIHVP